MLLDLYYHYVPFLIEINYPGEYTYMYYSLCCVCDAGTQHTYGDIHKLIRRSTAILRWNETLASPYFDHKINSTQHQVTILSPSNWYLFIVQENH